MDIVAPYSDFGTRPESHFIESVSFLLLRFGGLAIYHKHLHEMYAKQNSGITVQAYVNSVLEQYK